MVTTKAVAVGAIVIALLVVGIYIPFAFQSSPSTRSSTTSSTTSSLSTTTSTTTTTVTIHSSSSSVTNGSFSYLPTHPIKIQSVDAVTNQDQNGTEYVTFRVTLENIGLAPIYIAGGCGSGLGSSIPTSSVIQKMSGGPLCACAQFIIPINEGQNHTSTTPGCWSGYNYRLVQPGSVTVNLTLTWSTSGQNVSGANSTSILARFTFA